MGQIGADNDQGLLAAPQALQTLGNILRRCITDDERHQLKGRYESLQERRSTSSACSARRNFMATLFAELAGSFQPLQIFYVYAFSLLRLTFQKICPPGSRSPSSPSRPTCNAGVLADVIDTAGHGVPELLDGEETPVLFSVWTANAGGVPQKQAEYSGSDQRPEQGRSESCVDALRDDECQDRHETEGHG
jgi:hypothetical protein